MAKLVPQKWQKSCNYHHFSKKTVNEFDVESDNALQLKYKNTTFGTGAKC